MTDQKELRDNILRVISGKVLPTTPAYTVQLITEDIMSLIQSACWLKGKQNIPEYHWPIGFKPCKGLCLTSTTCPKSRAVASKVGQTEAAK